MPTKSPPSPPSTPLKDQAYDTLRALILSGEIEAGTLISERQMVERLAMSKTPIRVAFERLEQDGFVEILAQRGVRVRGLSDREIADHYDLRIALETWVARRAAEVGDPRALAGLQRAIDDQERLRRKVQRASRRTHARDVAAYGEQDAHFHALLAELAGNGEIARVLANQRERLARIVASHIRNDPGLLVASIAEHATIVTAVGDGDGAAAAQAMAEHLERGKAALLSR